MKYFLHDTSAFQDEKVTELFMAHGYEGLGLFYSILEKLAYQEKPVKTTVLKQQLSVGKKLEKCWLFLESLQLISSNNGETFNDNLLKFSEKYQVSKEKNRERVAQWREKQADTKPVTHYEQVRNAPKVNISKEKISTSNEVHAAYAATPPQEKKIETPELSPLEANANNDAAHTRGAAKRTAFVPPSAAELLAHMREQRPNNAPADVQRLAEKCFGYYASNGWRVGRNPMKDWRAACQTFLADLPKAAPGAAPALSGPAPAGYGGHYPRPAPVSQVAHRQNVIEQVKAMLNQKQPTG